MEDLEGAFSRHLLHFNCISFLAVSSLHTLASTPILKSQQPSWKLEEAVISYLFIFPFGIIHKGTQIWPQLASKHSNVESIHLDNSTWSHLATEHSNLFPMCLVEIRSEYGTYILEVSSWPFHKLESSIAIMETNRGVLMHILKVTCQLRPSLSICSWIMPYLFKFKALTDVYHTSTSCFH